MAILEISGLTKYFGGLAAVNNLDITVNEGEIVGLIGPNGAGKTTVFNLITGFVSPTKGQILFDRSDITRNNTHSIAEKGVVRTFQQNTYLPDLTVMQNLLMVSYLHPKIGIWGTIFNTPRYREKERLAFNHVNEILQFLGLDTMKNEIVQNLAHGYQRLLGIAIALCAVPKLLLLDEPFGGMNASEVSESLGFISKIRLTGTTILLVEHNMTAVMSLCDRIIVLNFGQKIAEGLPGEVSKNKEAIEAYLGGTDVA